MALGLYVYISSIRGRSTGYTVVRVFDRRCFFLILSSLTYVHIAKSSLRTTLLDCHVGLHNRIVAVHVVRSRDVAPANGHLGSNTYCKDRVTLENRFCTLILSGRLRTAQLSIALGISNLPYRGATKGAPRPAAYQSSKPNSALTSVRRSPSLAPRLPC